MAVLDRVAPLLWLAVVLLMMPAVSTGRLGLHMWVFVPGKSVSDIPARSIASCGARACVAFDVLYVTYSKAQMCHGVVTVRCNAGFISTLGFACVAAANQMVCLGTCEAAAGCGRSNLW
jgi:hypothetical protein